MLTLRRAPALVVEAPTLDAQQQAALALDAPVVRVLGGPGTGTSTVAVEVVLDRVDRLGFTPDQCLVLAPTRLAAAALRDRLTARLARTSTEPLARTHRAFGFAVLRREATLRGAPAPAAQRPEQDVVLRDLLAGHVASGGGPQWPERVAAALGTRGFRAELRDLLARAVEHGSTRPTSPSSDVGTAALSGCPQPRSSTNTTRSRRCRSRVPTTLRGSSPRPRTCSRTTPRRSRRVREQVRLIVVDDAQEAHVGRRPAPADHRPSRNPGHPPQRPRQRRQTFRGADPGCCGGTGGPLCATRPRWSAHGIPDADPAPRRGERGCAPDRGDRRRGPARVPACARRR
ncbi:MAG: AAA family ATPase [Actinomycetales bacterium]|uniref:AAA family ATPase n=1 Tax=Candidatus Phosphoribacter hodrii TaxID=2953743 RepID=A0A935M5C7_9MICO|nr:AAA family ATPase [Candidatus Phosphoribacter hodrii]